MRRCATDGYPFDGPPVLLPTSYDQRLDKFTFENLCFCSPSCAKGWLFRDAGLHPNRMQLFSLYCHRVLNMEGEVDICPDPRFLRDYMFDPSDGMTVAQFRSQNPDSTWAVAGEHIDPCVCKNERVVEAPKSDVKLDSDMYALTEVS